MVSYHLSNSDSDARKNITAQRMNEKLGWLRKFRSHLESWQRPAGDANKPEVYQRAISIGHGQKLKTLLDAEVDTSSHVS